MVIHFVINYISQYDYNMTKEKETDKNIDAGDKTKVNSSVPLLILLKENYHLPLLHVLKKTRRLLNFM